MIMTGMSGGNISSARLIARSLAALLVAFWPPIVWGRQMARLWNGIVCRVGQPFGSSGVVPRVSRNMAVAVAAVWSSHPGHVVCPPSIAITTAELN